jgi:hypothetical protein
MFISLFLYTIKHNWRSKRQILQSLEITISMPSVGENFTYEDRFAQNGCCLLPSRVRLDTPMQGLKTE